MIFFACATAGTTASRETAASTASRRIPLRDTRYSFRSPTPNHDDGRALARPPSGKECCRDASYYFFFFPPLHLPKPDTAIGIGADVYSPALEPITGSP